MKADTAIGNYSNILSVLKNGDPVKYRKVMTNYDSLLNRIQHMISVKTVNMCLEKANNNYIKKDAAGEKKALLLALKEMNNLEITDEDLSEANLKDYRNGSSLSYVKIEKRLHELGWSE